MVKHIVCFKLKDHAEGATRAENARLLKTRIEAMRGAIPGLLELEAGVNFEPSEAAYDLVLYAVLESRAALAAYQAHPAHLAVVDVLRRVRDARIVVDYDVE
jgi:hypothetical protein